MEGPTIGGVIAYPVTPFRRSDGAVDTDALRALIDRLVASGVHGIAPLGSAGESAYLSDAEWCEVAEASLEAVARRVPTVVGISDLTTEGAVRRARFAERAGADVVMVLPVSYWKLSEREIVSHYGAVAEAIALPVMVYNNPATSGIDMSPDLLIRLVSEFDNVTMVKESSGDVQRMHRLHELTDGRLPFFNGSNPLALEAFAAGATGWCTAAPCLFPAEILAFYETVRAGDLADARKQFYRLLPPLRFLMANGLPTAVKAGLALQGLDVGEPRRPLLPLEESRVRQLEALLAQL
ncbi:dihydrodipicolinate synthase family protein [Streptomyces spectabilis]|uniref:4-hydroxy-tetrahydrodipicolinate synthase n=1 Tax=Streptomyces spectabilis TaxID=68270 RepID=A0A5P2XJC8_STRST|nr:dihydrodipicolinate synthase family protein [Streptomyces spectabilis]MBB5105402.1 4-hydroxy-tetrahydrodipicolinate synthase [Streptomyces spectabilis]MCI3906595.1 dihydrodipicolinate synthase family protein [Streptomyces spectabilis]QEV63419.1 dihydrodipicolinate synthase family protein [Streptomyces spectabilis]GGV21361.1 dihydrodipicolinate synthase family protein [Streptomyces spectabilis]